jgi:WD40 repeat protein
MQIEIKKLQSLTGHRDCIYTIQSGTDNSVIYSAGGDGMVVRWDLTHPETGELLAQVPNSIYALYCDREENELIIGQNHQGIHFLDCETRKEIGSLQVTESAIFDIKKFGDHILVGTGGGVLLVVSRKNLNVQKKIKISQANVRSLVIDSIKNQLIVGCSDHHVYVFSLEDYSLVRSWKAHDNSVFTLAFNEDFSVLLSGSRDARLKAWDANNDYALKGEIVAHMYAINHIHFSPDYKHFVTCSMDKSIKVWSFDEMKLLKVIDKARHAGHGTSVNKLLWTSFDSQLVSASDDRTISIWKLIF